VLSCVNIGNHQNLKVQSNLCTTTILGTFKKWPLDRGGRYSEVPPIKLVLSWEVCGSGWLLLTGGRCSEVVVNTDLKEQSNLCTTTTLGTLKKLPLDRFTMVVVELNWSLLTGGCCSQVVVKANLTIQSNLS
jgi:hypothetical protein